MVRIINKSLPGTPVVERRPLVVEVAGPAGAGKTTLLKVLSERDTRILGNVCLPRTYYIPFVASNTLSLLPPFLRHPRRSRWFSREEMRALVYLRAWNHVLQRRTQNDGTVTILDHGPIFRLAWMHEFGPEIVKSRSFQKWSDKSITEWASTLSFVIWLDAPDAVLVERIETRNRWHVIKGRSEEEANSFLARCRASFDRVISTLTTNGGPQVLRFDTEQEALDQIVNKVLAQFASVRRDY